MEVKLLCYNRCCGQTFNPEANTPESCIHHPGVPVFHDAYKKWSCCDKKTTDFTEFLNIKGCTTSYHSNVKPPEPVKNNENDDKINKDEVYQVPPQPLKKNTRQERPDENLPLRKLKFNIGSSLKPLLEKLKETMHNDENNEKGIQIGTSCKNGGCRGTYQGEASNTQTCIYHSGSPVFHEGLKYWTCCVKRTSDFDSFLDQVGCTTGNHLWHKVRNPENKMDCRHDWHQTGKSVVISVFCKSSFPDISCIEANPVKLKLNIVFGSDRSAFSTEMPLFEVIDVDGSSVNYLGSKIEITLKKCNLVTWKYLCLPNKSVPRIAENNIVEDDDNINSL